MVTQEKIPAPDLFIDRLELVLPKFQHVAKSILTSIQGDDRLTLQQLRSLQAIAQSDGGMLTTKLAKRLNIASPTVTRIIDGLVERSLVDRIPDQEDRRRMRLVLREDGAELLKIYEKALHSHLSARLTELDRSQQARLWAALDDLDRILSEPTGEAPTQVVNG
jgi:DNA-binding MarR family transcriptional regulator